MKRAAMLRRRRFEPLPGRPGMGGRGLRERLASLASGLTSPRRGIAGASGRAGGLVCSGSAGFSGGGVVFSWGLRKPARREPTSADEEGSPPRVGNGGAEAGGLGVAVGFWGREVGRPASSEGAAASGVTGRRGGSGESSGGSAGVGGVWDQDGACGKGGRTGGADGAGVWISGGAWGAGAAVGKVGVAGGGGGAAGEVMLLPHLGHGPVTPARWIGTVSGAWQVGQLNWITWGVMPGVRKERGSGRGASAFGEGLLRFGKRFSAGNF
jgi:hypothetical protein